MKLQQITSHTDDPTLYHCDDSESNTFIPDGTQCEYDFSDLDRLSVIYVCEGNIRTLSEFNDVKDTSKCEKVSSFIGTTTGQKKVVKAGDTLYANTNNVLSIAKLEVKYPAYGLEVESSTGYDFRTTKDCYFRGSVASDEHTLNSEDVIVTNRDNREVVAINNPVNMVQGQTNIRGTGQVVSLNDVEGGDMVYIVEAGKYQKVLEAEDGFLYVDTTKTLSDNDIECIPRTQIGGQSCSDDAKLVTQDQVSCSTWSGTFSGYNPSSKPGYYCTYECKDNKPVETSDCKKVSGDCPVDKPYWNFEEQQCEGQLPQTSPVSGGFDTTLLLIIGGFVFVALLMIAISVKRK